MKKDSRFYTLFFAGLGIFLVILDQASKWIVNLTCTPGQPVTIIKNFCYVTLSYNTGIAFSFGAGSNFSRVVNILISLIVSICLAAYYVKKEKELSTMNKAIVALLFAGAAGNLIDRAFYFPSIVGFDGVIDFIQFYLGGGPSKSYSFFNPFATFNVADACLTIGVAIFILEMLLDSIKESKNGKDLSKDPRENNK